MWLRWRTCGHVAISIQDFHIHFKVATNQKLVKFVLLLFNPFTKDTWNKRGLSHRTSVKNKRENISIIYIFSYIWISTAWFQAKTGHNENIY